MTKAPNLVVTTAADDAGDAANCTPQPAPGTGTDSACSLRDAISYVNKNGGIVSFDSKVFAASNSAAQNTITLASTLLINQGMTDSRAGGERCYRLRQQRGDGVHHQLHGPRECFRTDDRQRISNILTNDGNGGGIYNAGILTVSGCNFSNNYTPGDIVPRLPVYLQRRRHSQRQYLICEQQHLLRQHRSRHDSWSGQFCRRQWRCDIQLLGRATVTNSTFVGNIAATRSRRPVCFRQPEALSPSFLRHSDYK